MGGVLGCGEIEAIAHPVCREISARFTRGSLKVIPSARVLMFANIHIPLL